MIFRSRNLFYTFLCILRCPTVAGALSAAAMRNIMVDSGTLFHATLDTSIKPIMCYLCQEPFAAYSSILCPIARKHIATVRLRRTGRFASQYAFSARKLLRSTSGILLKNLGKISGIFKSQHIGNLVYF